MLLFGDGRLARRRIALRKNGENGFFTPVRYTAPMVVHKAHVYLSGLAAALLLAAAPAHGLGAPAAPPAQDEPAGDMRTLTDADSYIRLQPVRTPIQTDLRIRGMLQVNLALDAPRSRMRALVRERELLLRDAFGETLLLYSARMYRWGDVPDADLIGELLQEDADRLLGPDQVRIVLDTVIIHAT